MTEQRLLGDRYELGQEIGRGGMAEVVEAQDLRLGRRVAIKLLRPDLARDPQFIARFRREAQSAAALNNPNIVAVYDTGEDVLHDGADAVRVPYIVMEYIDGVTLRQLLSSGRRLLPERALEITAGILGALGAVLNRPDVVGLDMTDKQLNDMVVSRKLGITFGELVKREQKRFSKAGDVKKLREQLAKRAKATEEQKAAHKAKYAAGVSTAEAAWRKSRGDVERVAQQARGIWQRFVNSSLEKLGPAAFARRGERGLL